MKCRYLVVALLLVLTGCGNVEKEETESFDIVTSFYTTYVFAKNIAKDVPNVTVQNMSDNHSGCLHDYHLDTSDMKKIENADVFIINGAGLESFLEKVYEKEELQVIDASDELELLQSKYEDEPNEHTWLSISNAISQVEKIGNELAEIDEANRDKYLENKNAYVDRLKSLRNQLRESLYDANKDIKIVTTHDAFPYFADDFDIDIVDVIEREEGQSPTQKEMKNIINNIKENEVCGIFIEPDYSSKLAQTIANEANVNIYTLDSITSGDGNIYDYENKMKQNIETIRESIK